LPIPKGVSALPRPMAPAGDQSAAHTIGAREGERIARVRNRRCYRGTEWRRLSDGGAGPLSCGRQVGQRQDRKRRRNTGHEGGSHWKNRVKRQHSFDPKKFD
jgi:hypothetical protein